MLLSGTVYWVVTAAVACGAVLDFLLGDPVWLPHPVVWIGQVIASMEKGLRRMFSKSPLGQFMAGVYLVVLVLFDTAAVCGGICVLGFYLHPLLGFAFETLWCAQSLALRGLMQAGEKVRDALAEAEHPLAPPESESTAVHHAVSEEGTPAALSTASSESKTPAAHSASPEAGSEVTRSVTTLEAGSEVTRSVTTLEAGSDTTRSSSPPPDSLSSARAAVGEIVGRDTDRLDEAGILRATVETIAENASDGVCAPMFYMLIGGAPAAMLYKAVNTMDSMVGYKNRRYFYYGKAAARLDDLANLIPSRLTALCMLLAAALLPGYDGKGALRVFLRDRYSQASPNAAQTESVMAGALGITLLGDAYYFGKLVHKETIGDGQREIELADIDRANRLILVATIIFFTAGMALRIAIGVWFLQ